MTKRKLKPDAEIEVDLFDIGIGVFHCFDLYEEYMLKAFDIEVDCGMANAIATYHPTKGHGGIFAMVLPKETPLDIIAHECSHIADYICEHCGIPIDMENTEVRAYLVGHLFKQAIKTQH